MKNIIIAIFFAIFCSFSLKGQLVGGQIKPSKIINIVFTSDPQYPWYDAIPSVKPKNDKEKSQNSERMIREQYQDINRLAGAINVAGVIINGDLTAYGHNWQLDKMKELLKILNVKYYLGLGNHDYENNVNDTFQNNASSRMIDYIIEWADVDKFKLDYIVRRDGFFNIRRHYDGSFSYSFDIDNLHFVQLHNHPHYNVSWRSGALSNYFYNIKKSIDWLEEDLRKARENGKYIVVNLHDAGALVFPKSVDAQDNDRLRDIMERYKVSVIFAGHFHSINGFYNYFGNIPIYLSGAASYQDYLRVEFDVINKKGRVYRREQKENDVSYRETYLQDFKLR